jgi:hypothetical protein
MSSNDDATNKIIQHYEQKVEQGPDANNAPPTLPPTANLLHSQVKQGPETSNA